MPCSFLRTLLTTALCALVPGLASAQSSAYTLSFPEPERGWMQVELVLSDVPARPVEVVISSASPGRYGPHDFGRHVTDVAFEDLMGMRLGAVRSSAVSWTLEQPPSSFRVRYRVSGDRSDGTYLDIDETHAHINMPASLLWARGFEDRPFTVRFALPPGRSWRVATQLFPGSDEQTFTAPNLPYLMDSPTELSAFSLREFGATDGARGARIRLAVHHEGTEADVDTLEAAAQRIVREAIRVFGELPRFDNGEYTFIADYLPDVTPDGMEHRNSTILTSRNSIRGDFDDLVGTMSHEFFHAWNVERIRPRSLEPFDLTKPNVSGELWLAEGFTQYYGSLVLVRAGLMSPEAFAADMGGLVGRVLASQARRRRTLEGMSRMAATLDSPTAQRLPNIQDEFLSYYTWGGAVALALDLSLRERSNDQVTLDDFMRALWARHGRLEGSAPGLVASPYTVEDLRTVLAEVSGDRPFARRFFARYIQGRDVVDYARLLPRMGMRVRTTPAGTGRRVDIVLGETVGATVTSANRRSRAAWLESGAASVASPAQAPALQPAPIPQPAN